MDQMTSKGLEALKHLYAKLSVKSSINDISENLQEYEIVEKELKEYESYREFLDNVEKGIVTYTPRDTWEEERKKLKRLEELEKAFDALSKDDEKAKKELSKEIERTRTLRIIKDKQDYALKTISDVIRDFNKGEFANAEIALQEITALLKEALE